MDPQISLVLKTITLRYSYLIAGGTGPVSFSVASASDVVDGAGEDSLLFAIDPSTGELVRLAGNPDLSLDFENPLDELADNIYKLTLSITDGVDTVTQDFTMSVFRFGINERRSI